MSKKDLLELLKKIASAGVGYIFRYYAAVSKMSFGVVINDEDGKPKQRKHPTTGVPMFSGSNPIYMEQPETFDVVIANRSTKADALCVKSVKSSDKGVFTSYQRDLLIRLEDMADNPGSDVIREDEWKKANNKEAYEAEKRMEKYKIETAEAVINAKEKGIEEGIAEGSKESQADIQSKDKKIKELELMLEKAEKKPIKSRSKK